MESVLEKFKDDVLNRKQVARVLNISTRTVDRYVQIRSIPFIKTCFSMDVQGKIFFSKRRLLEFDFDPEDKEAIEKWKDNIWGDKLAEFREQGMSLEIAKLGLKISRLIEKDELEDVDELGNKHFEMRASLREHEEKRILEFFKERLLKKEGADEFFIENLEGGKVLKLRKEDYVKFEDHNKNSAQRFRYEKRQR